MAQLTEAISLVGKGVTKAKHLSTEQAEAAMACILAGEADPVELGAFLVAMRIKEETAEELIAFVRVAQGKINPLPGPAPDLTISSYAGKRQTFPALIGAVCVLASMGVRVGIHGHGNPPDRTALAHVLTALDVKTDGDAQNAASTLSKAGVAYIGVERYLPVMHEMLELRRKMGLRTCFHTMARLVNPFGSTHQMVGISHARTFEKFAVASHALGFEKVVSFRGMEGEAEVNPLGHTIGYTLEADGRVSEFDIDPASLGIPKASRQALMTDSPEQSAAMLRDALIGKGAEIHREAIALTAAAGLLAANKADTLPAALEAARGGLATAGDHLNAWASR